MKAYAYETIINRDQGKFDEEVCKRIEEGWELHGNPYTIADDNGSCYYFCQAMVIDEATFKKVYVDG